jgi:hypothetical protein
MARIMSPSAVGKSWYGTMLGWPRRLARNEIVHRLVGEAGHLHVEQREVDVLAFTGLLPMRQCGEYRVAGIQAGQDVGQRDADFLRSGAVLVLGAAGDAHQAAHALDQEVIAGAGGIRPVLAEAGDRAVDDARIDRGDAGVVQPVFRQPADLEVFHQHVGLGGEAADQRRALGPGNVDRGGALVAVGAEVIGAFPGVVAAIGQLQERRPPGAGIVAAPRLLHLEHVSAEIGENLGRPGSGEDPRKVQHLDPVERARAVIHGAAMPGAWRPVQPLGVAISSAPRADSPLPPARAGDRRAASAFDWIGVLP